MKKTKLVFYPHNSNIVNDLNNEISINEEPVNYVQTYLYLGIDIDQHLTFKFFLILCSNLYRISYIY